MKIIIKKTLCIFKNKNNSARKQENHYKCRKKKYLEIGKSLKEKVTRSPLRKKRKRKRKYASHFSSRLLFHCARHSAHVSLGMSNQEVLFSCDWDSPSRLSASHSTGKSRLNSPYYLPAPRGLTNTRIASLNINLTQLQFTLIRQVYPGEIFLMLPVHVTCLTDSYRSAL